MRPLTFVLLLMIVLSGCKKTAVAVEDRDWDLVALGERDHPLGNGGRPVTLRFDSKTRTAGGNAGCNRYNGPYVLTADSVRFGPAISTKMACAEGMDVENAWLGALDRFRTWSVEDSVLVLEGDGGPLARFTLHRAP